MSTGEVLPAPTLLPCLSQESAINALPKTLGFPMHCCHPFPAYNGGLQVSFKEQGLWTQGFFQLCKEGLIYFSLARQSVADTHHNDSHIGCMLILTHSLSPHQTQGRPLYIKLLSYVKSNSLSLLSQPILSKALYSSIAALWLCEPAHHVFMNQMRL